MQTNHIAVLVRNIEVVSQTLPSSCKRHALEKHPEEGTLEQYITVGDEAAPALLLIQAIASGPYKRALAKRGAGLHHIGCVCSNIEEEIASGGAKRLLLHPISLETRKKGTVWLCRPGIPFFIELTQNPAQDAIPHKEALVQLPETISIPDYARVLSTNLEMKTTPGSSLVIEVGGIKLSIDPNAS
ncbi:MAG: hypothetical protein OEZ02_01080 [Anaerolineae bacterium]|nr:hypothetical protein [Anaerolineae bacterium]